MGTAMCPEFVDIYVRLGLDYKLPILLVKDYNTFNPRSYAGPCRTTSTMRRSRAPRRAASPFSTSCRKRCGAERRTRRPPIGAIFRNLPDGLTFLSLHFNAPGDFEVIEPSHAHIRTDEYALFKSGKTKQWATEIGLEVVGMRAMRDDLRARLK